MFLNYFQKTKYNNLQHVTADELTQLDAQLLEYILVPNVCSDLKKTR